MTSSIKHDITVIVILLLLIFSMVSYFFPQLKIKNTENRTLATFDMIFDPIKGSVVYYEEPIERFEAALSDQFPFRGIVIKNYFRLFNKCENIMFSIANPFFERKEDQILLYTIGDLALIEDTGYLTKYPITEEWSDGLKSKHIEQIAYIHEMFPKMKTYVYFVTQAFDMPWFNDYLGTSVPDRYIEIQSILPEYVKSDYLVYRNLEDYMNVHYKTDHHWNHKGSKRGYEDIYSMLSEDFVLSDIRVPLSENNVSETYNFAYLGSYGRELGELYEGFDDFSFYEYEIPIRNTFVIDPDTLVEISVEEMGLYNEYRIGLIDKRVGVDHYQILYGQARDIDDNIYKDGMYPFVIRGGGGEKNLLIVGDSYNRPMRDVLATHFDTTVYLDSRVLKKVPVDYIIKKYNIDAMVISSNASMWNYDDRFFSFIGEDD